MSTSNKFKNEDRKALHIRACFVHLYKMYELESEDDFRNLLEYRLESYDKKTPTMVSGRERTIKSREFTEFVINDFCPSAKLGKESHIAKILEQYIELFTIHMEIADDFYRNFKKYIK